MADRRAEIKKQLADLVTTGEALHQLALIKGLQDRDPTSDQLKQVSEDIIKGLTKFKFPEAYQGWYSRSLRVVEQLLPDRHDEFCQLYMPDRPPKELDAVTYTISHYLAGIVVSRHGQPVLEPLTVLDTKLGQQVNILRSAQDRLGSMLSDIKGVLEADLFDDEVAAAEDLLKKKHVRAAGVVAGVVLERHLKRIAGNHKIVLRKKQPTIGDLNDALKQASVYDTIQWRQIQRLSDIRNYAGHAKERDPTSEEIQELISGTDKIVKTLF
jgi:VanZ family protein